MTLNYISLGIGLLGIIAALGLGYLLFRCGSSYIIRHQDDEDEVRTEP